MFWELLYLISFCSVLHWLWTNLFVSYSKLEPLDWPCSGMVEAQRWSKCLVSKIRRFTKGLLDWSLYLSCFGLLVSSEESWHLIAHGSADYFDNVMRKFIVNNRTDALKTDINLFFTITNCRIARSRSLTRCMNSKFMCLSAHWQ